MSQGGIGDDRGAPGDPSGTAGAAWREETDSLGPMAVPEDRLWGAQTQRSIGNFDIGGPRFRWERPVIRAFGSLKAAAARANGELGELPDGIARAIVDAAEEVAAGDFDDHFPLVAFQTGSGTQTNMNANEVIANRAIQALGGEVGSRDPVHPNDHVNRGQSSNDVFPTVMHLATLTEISGRLVPAVDGLVGSLRERAERFGDVVTVGRTHLQDATPVRMGQQFASWADQVAGGLEDVHRAAAGLLEVALGGTAVGTGLNTHRDFAPTVVADLARSTGFDLRPAPNPFAALAAHDAMAATSAALRTLANAMCRVAEDVRFLASGPRNGIGELRLPANEPGSSIMPGKVNPTQVEAVCMVAAQVHGNDATVAVATGRGQLQLNVYKPVILHAVLESIRLLSDVARSFDERCVQGIEVDHQRVAEHLERNLMLVTALTPHIGYDRAAKVATHAASTGSGLRDAAAEVAGVDPADYDRWVRPDTMT